MISEQTEKPLACWKSKELHLGEVIDCLTIIFKSGGCSWNRCRMCGYKNERFARISEDYLTDRLMNQLSFVLNEFDPKSYQMVKIFTSGSFFDSGEVPPKARSEIGRAFRGKTIIAESRTEFVKSDILSEFIEKIDDGSKEHPFYVAMGLETTNDYIRDKCIDKGHTYDDFKKAVAEGRDAGSGIKTYLMMKPPYLTESEALSDMKKSIADVTGYSDIISMNLCTVQNKTEVERLWKQKAYRPPYLWSVLDVLIDAKVHILCDPVGGGKSRGPHNCGVCDPDIVGAIRDYSLTDDRDLLKIYYDKGCGCMDEWRYVLREEKPYCMPLTS
ncbi:radical SAM enzyme (TIGR01210 family) [Methanomicrobium sp. W14]|uniref:archaeosine biosynthesis radical SAM protein RaSEA n=1 Tax=Methanomicrobium sp. W14 TaxID=2817839 RepID=UPI001AE9DDED|nr:archaeosine biosynthesis radical SAM protein RaSEA [Methanomicrobium sp. W14]MBP2132289.1 radical SAM enzyme (TIGR01210 family) [Methanomicrobium sp. W14]